jgi:stage III sporulation protein AG
VNTTTGKKTIQERDQSGGTRQTTEDSGSGQLVMNRNGAGGEQPVVERELAPQVAGVLVVAEGAGDSRVRAKLFEATRVAMGIEPQKIVVLPMERKQ